MKISFVRFCPASHQWMSRSLGHDCEYQNIHRKDFSLWIQSEKHIKSVQMRSLGVPHSNYNSQPENFEVVQYTLHISGPFVLETYTDAYKDGYWKDDMYHDGEVVRESKTLDRSQGLPRSQHYLTKEGAVYGNGLFKYDPIGQKKEVSTEESLAYVKSAKSEIERDLKNELVSKLYERDDKQFHEVFIELFGGFIDPQFFYEKAKANNFATHAYTNDKHRASDRAIDAYLELKRKSIWEVAREEKNPLPEVKKMFFTSGMMRSVEAHWL